MKNTFVALALIFALAAAAVAQTGTALPQQWAGAGVSWNQYAAPPINGFVTYARKIAGDAHPLYSFSSINFTSVHFDVPFKLETFRVMTTTESGLAPYIIRFGRFDVFGVGTAGLAAAASDTGTDLGLAVSGGMLALTKIKGGWDAGVLVRVFRSGVSGVQWSAGLVIGWGQ